MRPAGPPGERAPGNRGRGSLRKAAYQPKPALVLLILPRERAAPAARTTGAPRRAPSRRSVWSCPWTRFWTSRPRRTGRLIGCIQLQSPGNVTIAGDDRNRRRFSPTRRGDPQGGGEAQAARGRKLPRRGADGGGRRTLEPVDLGRFPEGRRDRCSELSASALHQRGVRRPARAPASGRIRSDLPRDHHRREGPLRFAVASRHRLGVRFRDRVSARSIGQSWVAETERAYSVIVETSPLLGRAAYLACAAAPNRQRSDTRHSRATTNPIPTPK